MKGVCLLHHDDRLHTPLCQPWTLLDATFSLICSLQVTTCSLPSKNIWVEKSLQWTKRGSDWQKLSRICNYEAYQVLLVRSVAYKSYIFLKSRLFLWCIKIALTYESDEGFRNANGFLFCELERRYKWWARLWQVGTFVKMWYCTFYCGSRRYAGLGALMN